MSRPLRQLLTLTTLLLGVTGYAAESVRESPYGTWKSPITAADLGISGQRFSQMTRDGDSLYWVESSVKDARGVIMRRRANGDIAALTPPGFSAMTRVHEYGGGALTVDAGNVYFTNVQDQQLYVQREGTAPTALTTERNTRYANCSMDRHHARLICVREDHRLPGEPRNELVGVPMDGTSGTQVLFSGSNFVSDPAVSADGKRIAFLSWSHPNMPWDRVTLRVANFRDDGMFDAMTIVNPDIDEAARSPMWAPDGSLYFIGDRDDWWNILRWDGRQTTAVTHEKLDFSFPAWDIGERTYGLLPDGRIVALFNDHGVEGVGIIDPGNGRLTRLAPSVVQAHALALDESTAYFEAGFRDRPQALVEVNLTSGQLLALRAPPSCGFESTLTSPAKSLEYPTGGGHRAYGFYYSPVNPRYKPPKGARPPLIVVAHGGPTLNTTPAYNISLQYWTSRGFAVLDLNYRGSTGFGRAYRRSLYGQFGVADVEDAVYGARAVVAQGGADPRRLLIRGGSAGGFVVLAALAFHDTFAAGANYFGVSDLTALRDETHKFESHYADVLVGPYDQFPDRYSDRSPINHLERFTRPLITFQGLKDAVVPPVQSARIVSALRAKHVPVAYLTFPDEAHGFRTLQANIIAREAELCFYGRVLGFQPAGPLPDLKIENLPGGDDCGQKAH